MTDESRARAGAAYLDLRPEAPGWRERIDVDTLNMHDPDHCIFAQVFGTYKIAIGILNLSFAERIDLGFTNDSWWSEDSFVQLTAAWRKVILEQPGRPLLPVRAKRQRVRRSVLPKRPERVRVGAVRKRFRVVIPASAPAGKDEK